MHYVLCSMFYAVCFMNYGTAFQGLSFNTVSIQHQLLPMYCPTLY